MAQNHFMPLITEYSLQKNSTYILRLISALYNMSVCSHLHQMTTSDYTLDMQMSAENSMTTGS